MNDYSENYLLDRKVKIYQPNNGYHASSDAVLLASAVIDVKNNDRILDVGSGTGAIALCLCERFKDKNICVKGLEIQSQLAELANHSAKVNNFEFAEFINADIKNCPLPFCSFNHVVSNPPYAEKDLPSPQNSKAAAHNFSTVPNLGEWIRFCIKMIRPQGYFYMINRASALEEILYHIHGKLGDIHIMPLISKSGQNAKRVIVTARKDSKAPLVICPPLIIHENDGRHTPEAEAILRAGKTLNH